MDVKDSFALARAIGKETTRGKLEAARIIEVSDEDFKPLPDGLVVHCMFNPYEYTVSQANSFAEKETNKSKAELSKVGPQTLKLLLVFDTFEESEGSEKRDVTKITDQLWTFMSLKSAAPSADRNAKRDVPMVAFHWGVFFFVSYITSMSQKYTLFTKEGIPVRADVDVTFTQYADVNDFPRQNPTSGGGPINRVHYVVAGDRLDLIANDVYKDPTKWRLIANYNQLLHPTDLRPGQVLTIPFEQELL